MIINMQYNEKLRLYFKKNGISQKEAAERLGHAPAMMSRFLSGVSVLDANFIIALVKEFPDVDLKYIFSEEIELESMVSEPGEDYGIKEENIIGELELIEKKISSIRNVLARKSHAK
jgi:transcriptional regulator with XRE-family HTH domain